MRSFRRSLLKQHRILYDELAEGMFAKIKILTDGVAVKQLVEGNLNLLQTA